MSNLYVNIRIIHWHIQVTREWRIQITENKYEGAPLFAVYALFGYRG